MHQIFSYINIGEDLIIYLLFSMLFFVILISLFKTYTMFFNIGKLNLAVRYIEKEENLDLEESSIFGDLIKFLYGNISLSPESLQEVYDAKTIQLNKKLSKGNNFLATVGSNAPFIGLFGTVLGVITAFNGLSKGGAGNDVIMTGISTSLIATALGLIVSLPAVFAFNIFKGKQNSINDDCHIIFKLFMAKQIENEIKNISKDNQYRKEDLNYISDVKKNKKNKKSKVS